MLPVPTHSSGDAGVPPWPLIPYPDTLLLFCLLYCWEANFLSLNVFPTAPGACVSLEGSCGELGSTAEREFLQHRRLPACASGVVQRGPDCQVA